jgi:hypothetical protein
MRRTLLFLILAIALASPQIRASDESNAAVSAVARVHGVLWQDPAEIRSRDLFYGPGGKDRQPQEPLTFLKEDLHGTNAKFDVRDAAGNKWRVKLGVEARPETAASRLLWAVGFVANDNYYVREVKVLEMPKHLHRGQKLLGSDGTITARLQRPPEGKKIGTWEWRHNPFYGTREFNGLRVMMALLSNWDLKTDNNAIYGGKHESDPSLYEVSDVGASFGRMGESYTSNMSKDNLRAYQRSKFITKVSANRVSFNFPTHLPYLYIFNLPFFVSQSRQHWIGQNIPRADAKWIGGLLAQLSHQQICDAFRAAGYPPEQVQAYASTVETRIRQLSEL